MKIIVSDDEKVISVAKRLKAAPGEMEKVIFNQKMLENISGEITVQLEVLE